MSLAGLPLLRRVVLAAERAGFRRVLVAHPARGAPGGTSAEALRPDKRPPLSGPERIVIVPGNIVPQPAWLRRRLETLVEPERLQVDSDAVAVIETKDPEAVVAAVEQPTSAKKALAALGAMFNTREVPADAEGRFILASGRDRAAAEAWLFRGLIKPNEGLMSRLVERRLSLALTRRLVTTRVTPNALTLVSLAIGLLSAPFFLSPSPLWQLTGALLFLAHSILDGCDGELARLKFMESDFGARLDVAGDNTVHAAVFAAMALGWSREAQVWWPLALGAVTVSTTLASAVVVYGRGMRASVVGKSATRLTQLADMLVYRDFIYLIVGLAALGKAWWFLGLAAIGAPVFLLLLVWLGRRD
ncbi:MAG TPA: CDP-alcohol phosphatidyltransferase family protein [Methylomirabilota bacterium]|jgi:phosphatidylglycerophosphate synthase